MFCSTRSIFMMLILDLRTEMLSAWRIYVHVMCVYRQTRSQLWGLSVGSAWGSSRPAPLSSQVQLRCLTRYPKPSRADGPPKPGVSEGLLSFL